jgi:hypothetical protein
MEREKDDPESVMIPVGEGHGEDLNAVDYLRKLEAKGRSVQAAQDRLVTAIRNERWIHGEQSSSDLNELLVDEEIANGGIDGNEDSRNLLRNFWLTFSARVTEEAQITRAYPYDASANDVIVASWANKILDYCDTRANDTDSLQRIVGLAQMHSVAGFKTCWDPSRDTYTAANVESGDIASDVVTIFDYWTSGADDIEEDTWCCFRRYVERPTATAMALKYGIPPEDIKGAVRDVTDGVEKRDDDFVAITEHWHVPEGEFGRFPEGLYLVFLGDHLIEMEPFPYAHGELPLSIVKTMWMRGSPYGSTHVDDAIRPQRAYNRMVSIQAARAELLRDTYLLTTPDIRDQIINGSGDRILTGAPDVIMSGKAASWVDPPAPAELLDHEERRAREQIADAFGISETFGTGTEIQGRGPAGKTVAFYNKIQGMKLSEMMRSLHRAILRRDRQRIALFQQYAPDELLIGIVGQHRFMELPVFRGANLRGLDLKLEPASGAERLRAVAADEALVALKEGRIDPARASATVNSGLTESVGDVDVTMQMNELVSQALAGSPVQPPEGVDPLVAADELMRLYGVNRENPNAAVLLQMAQWYREQASAAQAQPPIQGGAQPMQGPGGVPVE